MLHALKHLLGGGAAADATPGDGRERDGSLEVAAAALLLESANADDHVHTFEHAAIAHALATHFRLDAAGVEVLLARAEQARRDAIDLHGFSTVLVNGLDERQRLSLLEVIWRVILSDGQLTADESILARKLGNLLDLRPEDVAVAVRRARGEQAPRP